MAKNKSSASFGRNIKETAFVINPVSFSSACLELDEAIGLTEAIALDIIFAEDVKIKDISPSHYLGKGATARLAELSEELEPSVVIMNCKLSPVQQRNLELKLKAKVIDRTGLILEIFGDRAHTREGKIQVELAQLEYQRSRLVKSWTHLERQRGGTGTVGGPGETQLEIDRRIITDKITSLKKDLEDVKRTRNLARKSRERVPFPIVALVGYTNAGKSTLFNYMTGADIFAQDMLFATLDPTMRRLELSDGQPVILSDTVGFITDLPTDLIAAFRSTLEQVEYADVILHVMDASHAEYKSQREVVISIMEDLGIEYYADDRVIEVMNKHDILSEDRAEEINRLVNSHDNVIAISALSGQGVDNLKEKIRSIVQGDVVTITYKIPASDGRAISWLYSNSKVISCSNEENEMLITTEISKKKSEMFHCD